MNKPLKLQEIARLVQAESDSGTKNILITGVGSLKQAQPGQLTFLSDDSYLPWVKKTQASAILTNKKIDTDVAQLIVSNPKLAFAKVLSLFSTFPTLPAGVSSKAHIEEAVRLGSDVTIAPFVYVAKGTTIGNSVILYPGVFIGEGSFIGDDSILFPNVTLYAGTRVGKRVLIHAGTVLGADGFGYTFDGKRHVKIPQIGTCIVEDDVEIGANSAIDRGALDTTRIGEGTKIDNLVQVGHNCQLGPHNILCGQVGLAGGIESGKVVMFGGQAGVADQTLIPDGVKLGPKSGLMKNIPLEPHQAYMGQPALKFKDFFRSMVVFSKLPDLYNRLKSLEKRVAQLLDKPPQV